MFIGLFVNCAQTDGTTACFFDEFLTI